MDYLADISLPDDGYVRTLYDTLLYTSLYLALIAVVEVVSVTLLLDIELTPAPLIVGTMTLTVYLNDQLLDLKTDDLDTDRERVFIERHSDALYVVASVCYGIAVSLSVFGGPVAFAITLVPGVAWLLYASSLVTSITERVGLRVRQVKDVFVLNSSLVGLAWALAVVALPTAYAGSAYDAGVLALFGYFFLRVFTNTEISNVPDVAEDRAAGVSTFGTVLGLDRTRQTLYVIDLSCAGLAVIAAVNGYVAPFESLALLAGVGYSLGVTSRVGRLDDHDGLTQLAELEYVVMAGVLGLVLLV